jgi:hypothetical protein
MRRLYGGGSCEPRCENCSASILLIYYMGDAHTRCGPFFGYPAHVLRWGGSRWVEMSQEIVLPKAKKGRNMKNFQLLWNCIQSIPKFQEFLCFLTVLDDIYLSISLIILIRFFWKKLYCLLLFFFSYKIHRRHFCTIEISLPSIHLNWILSLSLCLNAYTFLCIISAYCFVPCLEFFTESPIIKSSEISTLSAYRGITAAKSPWL